MCWIQNFTEVIRGMLEECLPHTQKINGSNPHLTLFIFMCFFGLHIYIPRFIPVVLGFLALFLPHDPHYHILSHYTPVKSGVPKNVRRAQVLNRGPRGH